jgi:hypothetical protein
MKSCARVDCGIMLFCNLQSNSMYSNIVSLPLDGVAFVRGQRAEVNVGGKGESDNQNHPKSHPSK